MTTGIKLDGDRLFMRFQRIYDSSCSRDVDKDKAEDKIVLGIGQEVILLQNILVYQEVFERNCSTSLWTKIR